MRHLPPRRSNDGYAHDPRRTYPFGYKIADLGPADHSHELHASATTTKKSA